MFSHRLVHGPIISKRDCTSGISSTKYMEDDYLYVFRKQSDVFPWEEWVGFETQDLDTQIEQFGIWKESNVGDWSHLSRKFRFDPHDPAPWRTYRLACDEVEMEWIEIEGESFSAAESFPLMNPFRC